jgi:hypothetical protein
VRYGTSRRPKLQHAIVANQTRLRLHCFNLRTSNDQRDGPKRLIRRRIKMFENHGAIANNVHCSDCLRGSWLGRAPHVHDIYMGMYMTCACTCACTWTWTWTWTSHGHVAIHVVWTLCMHGGFGMGIFHISQSKHSFEPRAQRSQRPCAVHLMVHWSAASTQGVYYAGVPAPAETQLAGEANKRCQGSSDTSATLPRGRPDESSIYDDAHLDPEASVPVHYLTLGSPYLARRLAQQRRSNDATRSQMR